MNRNESTSETSRPDIVWLGDDFTGAAAVMEVLTFAGLPSILFLGMPTPAQLSSCGTFRAFGIATMARARSPEWMEEHLPPLLAFLDGTGADIVHYKICSTLDSSPRIGSIGKAIDLALNRFGPAPVPVITAAPRMGRYQAFGNLFCTADDTIFRLDRHPVMARHPVTPMQEADVARHIGEQTHLPTLCLDLARLSDSKAIEASLGPEHGARICTIDMVDGRTERIAGEMLWNRRTQNRFVVGSQGVEYALVSHFQETGKLNHAAPPVSLGHAPKMAAVSGSVSPVTAAQIDWARNNGFTAIRLDALKLCLDGRQREAAEQDALLAAKRSLSEGLSPLVYTAEGPEDPVVKQLKAAVPDQDTANTMIGQSLGRILKDLVEEAGLNRVVVSGGDTSGLVCSALGIFALEAVSPTIPGAAICRARSEAGLDGLEIALKGGQMGSRDYFGWIREGGGARP